MRETMTRIRSHVFGGGSFGLGAPGQLVRVWFCGAYIGDKGTLGNASGPCVHRTRTAARSCPAIDRATEYDAPELSGRRRAE